MLDSAFACGIVIGTLVIVEIMKRPVRYIVSHVILAGAFSGDILCSGILDERSNDGQSDSTARLFLYPANYIFSIHSETITISK